MMKAQTVRETGGKTILTEARSSRAIERSWPPWLFDLESGFGRQDRFRGLEKKRGKKHVLNAPIEFGPRKVRKRSNRRAGGGTERE